MISVGRSSVDVAGGLINDGYQGRIVDPVSGAGLFNANLDPAIVDVDPLTGADSPTGTDLSFGAPVRRQIQTGVVNGDWAVGPPDGVGTDIVSDPLDVRYNPLPGWRAVMPDDGSGAVSWVADAAAASGYAVQFYSTTGASTTGDAYLEQWVPCPMTAGQQYRALLSVYDSYAGVSTKELLRYQFYKWDAATAIGFEVSWSSTYASAGELKLDAGLIPPTAGWLRLRVGVTSGFSQAHNFYEARCAFLPAEATLGLKALSVAGYPSITNTQTRIVGSTIPANSLVGGSVYRFTVFGTVNSTVANNATFRIRIGPTTLTGNIAASLNPVATTTAAYDGFYLTGLLSVRSTGASGSAIGHIALVFDTEPFSGASTRVSDATSAVTVDTTVANELELTAITDAATTEVLIMQAVLECVMAS